MSRPQGTVFVIPLRPRKLILPAVLLAGIAALLLVRTDSSAARYAPVPLDPPAELRLVPPDVFAVVHVNVSGLMSHELTKTVMSFIPRGAGTDTEKVGEREFGTRLADVDAFAFLGGKEHQVTIITTRKPFDSKKVLAALAPKATEHTFKGKVFHVGIDPWRLEQPGIEDRKEPRFEKDLPRNAPKDGIKERDKFIPPKQEEEEKPPPRKDGPSAAEFAARQAFAQTLPPQVAAAVLAQDEPREGPARLERWAPAVYFLSDRTYATGRAHNIMHFIDTAVKPDEQHSLHEALSAAGKHHLTLGVTLPEELARELRWEMRREMRHNPLAEMSYQNLRPLLALRQMTITADVGDDSYLNAVATFPDARAASKAQEAVRFALQLFKGGINQLEEQAAKALGGDDKLAGSKLAEMLDNYRAAFNNAQIKVDGSSVKLGIMVKTDADQFKAVMTELAPKIEAASNRVRSANNLKQLAIGLHNYEASMGHLPPASAMYKEGKPVGLSWRVQLLPYVEEERLYRQFHLDEPWDSDHNKKLIEKMPKVFAVPGVKTKEAGLTHYQAISSQQGETLTGFPLVPQLRQKFQQITDGLTNSIAFVEAAEPVIWTKPDDVPFNAKGKMLPLVGGTFSEGFHVAFFDGSVRFVRKKDLTEEVFKAACTTQGGETPSWPGGEDDEDRPPRGYKDRTEKIRPYKYEREDRPGRGEGEGEGTGKDATRPADKPSLPPLEPKRPLDKLTDK